MRYTSTVRVGQVEISTKTDLDVGDQQEHRRISRLLETYAIQNQQQVGQLVSARRNGLGLTSATFNRITRLDLFHPYQMIKRHELLPGDYQRREQFCQWLINRPDQFLDNVIIGDEAGFALKWLPTFFAQNYTEKKKQIDTFSSNVRRGSELILKKSFDLIL